MDELEEARKAKYFKQHYIEYSPLWNSREVTDAIDARAQQIIAWYTSRKRLFGVDKESLDPYPADWRHSHVFQKRLDPIIMYRIIPGTDGDPTPTIHFIVQTTHAEAFRGNAEKFIETIRQFLGESLLMA